MRCANCGFDNPAGFKFCGECGTALASAAESIPAPVGERRQLTVMYCDLVGSTELSASLDPEDLREVLRGYRAACTRVVERLDGRVAQYLGDGLLVHFGFPQAHEDDAHRAVRGGLEIVETVKSLAAQLPQTGRTPLAVRVGIHTGLVVVDEIGCGVRLEHVPLGEAPNIAASLQAPAEQNSVLMSAAIARLVRDAFELRDLGAQPVKGIPTPIQTFGAVRALDRRTPGAGPFGRGLTPLVGRARELAVLRRCWEGTKRQGHGVILLGEPGIGKTRMVHVMKELVAANRGVWLEGGCSPYHRSSAFYPVVQLLEQALDFRSGETADDRLRKIETAVDRYGVSAPDAAPLLASLLSLPPHRYSLPALAPQTQKQRIMDAALDLLHAMAGGRAVLLIVENLHWADPSSLELLTLLIQRAQSSSFLALFTSRPEFQPPWSAAAGLTQITLDRLSREETETLAERAVGKAVPPEVLAAVAAKTDGVPLFIEELMRMVLETGLVLERAERYELSGPLPALAIPATLHDSLMARLDRLPGARGVAQVAAVLGRTFAYDLLNAVSPVGGEGLEEKLDMLVASGLLAQTGSRPRATYTFKHALIQDTAYETLLKSARRRYHERAARALVGLFPEVAETQPELVAHHFTAADAAAEAVVYWKRAAEHALQRSANVEAIVHLTRGLAVLGRLPDGPDRARHELEIQVGLIVPLIATRGYGAPQVEAACLRARELCRQFGQVPQLFPVLWGLWQFYVVRAELQTAREIGEQLLTMAGTDSTSLMLAHEALGVTLFFIGAPAEAQTHLDEAIARYDPAAHRSLAFSYAQDPGVAARSYSAVVQWGLGYPERALRAARTALEHAASLGHPYSRVFALNMASILLQLRGEPRRIHEQTGLALRLSGEHQIALGVALATVLRAWASGDTAELRRGLAAWRATGARLFEPYYLGLLADAAYASGHVEEGLADAAEALMAATVTGEHWYEAELHRLRGELLRRCAKPDLRAAEHAFYRALDIARQQGARALEMRAAVSLRRLRRDRRRRWALDGVAMVHEAVAGGGL